MKTLILCLVMLFGITTTKADLVQNGSFEIGPSTPPNWFTTLYGGATDITDWVVLDHSIDYIGDYWQSSDGLHSIDLSGRGYPGGISQDLNTIVGSIYNVKFDLAGNPDGLPTTKNLQVSVGDVSQIFIFDTVGTSHDDMGWISLDWNFIASSTITTLTFRSLDQTAYGPALDNVRVEQVPAPGAVLLCGIGLVLVGLRKFRRGDDCSRNY